MYRTRLRRTYASISVTLWLLLSLATLLAGCGDTTIARSTNACSLVNAQQIAQVVKTPVKRMPAPASGKFPVGADFSTSACDYESSNGNLSVILLLEVFSTRQIAQKGFSKAPSRYHVLNSIDDLGDQALVVQTPTPALFVLKDNAWLMIVINRSSSTTGSLQNDPGFPQDDIGIAQFAVQKM